MAETRAQLNRKVRQEALREQLAEQCRVQHIIDNIKKIEDLDASSDTFQNEVLKYKTSNEQRLKLINKYLPDLRNTELTGDGGEDLEVFHIVELAAPEDQGGDPA